MKPLTMSSFLLWLRLKPLFESADPSTLTPLQKEFARVNGFKLLPPGANPDLVSALQHPSGGPDLDYNLDDLLFSVSVNTGIPVRDLKKMPVPDFNRLRAAVERSINYKLCALALLLGARFKEGSPCPSWLFDKKDPLPKGFKRME